MNRTIQILVVEDEALIAEDIKDICELEGYKVPYVCYNYKQAIDVMEKTHFDLALLDINLENTKSGIDIAQFIMAKEIPIPIIFLTSYSDKSTLHFAKSCKPIAYITKPFQKEQLISTIEIGLDHLTSTQLGNSNEATQYNLSRLTQREYEIAHLICQGKSNEEIAGLIYLSINTIKFHLKNIYEKLDISSRTQLIIKMRK
jgi:DNA-binding NarL/FixJ family response regulator